MFPDVKDVISGLGLEPADFPHVERLSQLPGHAVWRVGGPQRTGILTWLPEGNARIETAARGIDLLKAAQENLSLSLNYSDFYWTNLARFRQEGTDLKAVIFDYHLLGIDLRYSDCRNATGSLAGAAADAFRQAYGQCHPHEEILERPLAALYNLRTAAQAARLPALARESIQQGVSGQLQSELFEAQALASSQYQLPDEHAG